MRGLWGVGRTYSRLLPTQACLEPTWWSSWALSVCYVCLALWGEGREARALPGQSIVLRSPITPRTESKKRAFRSLNTLKDSRHLRPVPRAAGIDTGIDEAGSNYHLRLCSSRSRHLPATSLTNGALLHVCRCMIDGSVCSVAVEYGVRARSRLGCASIW